jgi:hypothetical protein
MVRFVIPPTIFIAYFFDVKPFASILGENVVKSFVDK